MAAVAQPDTQQPAPARGVLVPRLSARQELWLIVGLAVLVRLADFTGPYTSLHWIKQLQIAPIAHNFYHHGYNLLWPQTDYTPDPSKNYIEIEFQLVTWLTALLYPVLGEHEWVGRLVTIAFSLGAMLVLYRLLGLHLGRRPATWGLLFFAFTPSSWYYARALMSETPMLFFSAALVYCFSRWLGMRGEADLLRRETPTAGTGWFLLTALCGALAFLVKLPAAFLFLVLVWLAWRKWGWGFLGRPLLYLLAVLMLAPALAYYHHARVNLGAHYFTVGVGFGGGMWFRPEDFLRPGNYSLMLNRLLREHLTAVGLVLLPIGLCLRGPYAGSRWGLFHVWLGAALVYLVAVSGGNIRQSYYQLHLLLPAAGLIGLGWARLAQTGAVNRWSNALLVALFLALCGWGVQPMFEEFRPIREAAAALQSRDPSGQPVILFPPGYGCLYYFHRPGWCAREGLGRPESEVAPEDVPGPLYVTSRIKQGARWAVYFLEDGPGARPDLLAYLRAHYGLVAEKQDPETHTGWMIFDLSGWWEVPRGSG